ncbi:MAG: leucine-rich repeat protein [Verrucomicrobia bacterium]|nr:leucine-rich repeat protein [Verrucomicrobiota bacterium]
MLCCMVNAVSADQFEDFTYTDNGTTITITAYTGSGGALAIPASIIDKPVTSIGDAAFSGLTSVASVTIPDSVTSIGVGAFNACGNLTGVTIGNSVTSIGNGAFNACGKLASVTIPDSVTSLGISVFFNCAGLTSVTLGNSLASIGDRTFSKCISLTSVTIGNSVTSIGVQAFNQCSSLTTVTIPSSVTSIGNQSFYSCAKLTGVYFKGNAPTLGASVFDLSNNVIVYYFLGTTGWPTPPPAPFGGRPTVSLNAPAPAVTTSAASGITATAATLNGTVNPNGLASTAQFDYGLTDTYGSTAGVTLSPDNGSSVQAVSAGIGGLQAGQTYHYRLTATNGGGTSSGADLTFTTHYVLTIDALHGTVPGAGQYAPNTTVELTATADPGYVFTVWTGDASGTDNPLAVLMNANQTVTANFAPDTRDSDGDGLNNYDEVVTYGTNPTLPDTDGDGLPDGAEVTTYGTNPTLPDTDGDGLPDGAEVSTHGTNPTLPDTDGDGLPDGAEVTTYGTNPTLPDTDGDGLPDGAEVTTYGSNPLMVDTDDDGLNDRVEVEVYHSNPTLKDSDGDGFDDLFEVNTGFDPTLATSTPDALSTIRTAVEFRFNAATGVSYRIEASSDLENWSILETDIIGQSAVVIRFYSTENQPQRFFRALRN